MAKKRKADASAGSNGTPKAVFAGGSAAVDPTLDSLFSSSLGPISKPAAAVELRKAIVTHDEQDDEELSSIDSDAEIDINGSETDEHLIAEHTQETAAADKEHAPQDDAVRKRKRKRQDDDLEGQYMAKIAKSEAKELARLKAEKRNQLQATSDDEEPDVTGEQDSSDNSDDDLEAAASPPPVHETVSGDQPDVEKAGRTVFLANVSTEAITSKAVRKSLMSHLSSHLEALGAHKPPHKVESLRFRSTAFASAIPKRAAFTKKELMDATTKATNAYAVYSTKEAAREAARKLNGTIVLGRHLRVDEVAHPAKTDHKRCIFVGNLGFVDDESIMQANEDGEDSKKKRQKEPADVEEGLWREFSKAGAVESVRVVRDAKTRVGKGFAYVQFVDENSVEAALLYEGKKFPPMLPRKLRVTRAKAVKRNAAKKGGPPSRPLGNAVYAPKVSSQQQSLHGRAGRLFGKAGAAKMQGRGTARDGGSSRERPRLADGIKPPESFIFEGHRATTGQKPKLKVKKAKTGKPTSRSSKRGSAWKAGGGKK